MENAKYVGLIFHTNALKSFQPPFLCTTFHEQSVPTDRPVEEDVLEFAHGNHFQHHQFREVR